MTHSNTTATTVAAFQTWFGGKSSLCLASVDGQEAVNDFIERHMNSGTFAKLHAFANEQHAIEAFDEIDC